MMVADTPTDKILAILGLGNPGRRYAKNRHNFGYMILDRIAFLKKEEFARSDEGFVYCQIILPQAKLILAKPITYMNNSGQAALSLNRDFGVLPSNMLVICDDCNIPLGKIRFRAKGSDGGHNGLKSISSSLDTKDFPRLRLGIGLNPPDTPLEEYVLGDFGRDEVKTVEKVVERTNDLIEELILNGYEASSKTLKVA